MWQNGNSTWDFFFFVDSGMYILSNFDSSCYTYFLFIRLAHIYISSLVFHYLSDIFLIAGHHRSGVTIPPRVQSRNSRRWPASYNHWYIYLCVCSVMWWCVVVVGHFLDLLVPFVSLISSHNDLVEVILIFSKFVTFKSL